MSRITITPIPANSERKEGVSILLHGITDSGKTRILGTLLNNVVLDTEGKPLTLQQDWIGENEVSYVECLDVDTVLAGMSHCLSVKRPCSVDPITSLQTSYNLSLLSDAEKLPKHVANELKSKGTLKDFEFRDKMEQNDWQYTLIAMLRPLKWIPVLKAAGIDVIFTSHSDYLVMPYKVLEVEELIDKNPTRADSIRNRYSLMWPSVQGQIRRQLGAYFDAIGYMEKEASGRDNKYYVSFGVCEYAFTKNAPCGLPTKLEVKADDHTLLQRIVNKMKGISEGGTSENG